MRNETLKTRQFIALSVVFLLSLLSAVITEIYYLVLVPFVVLVFYAGWNNPRIIFLTLLFSLPFSFEYNFTPTLGTDIPDEGLMLLTSLVVFALLIYNRYTYTRSLVSHPLVFAITLALGKGFWQVFIAVGLTMWVSVARLVRGQVMAIRELEYIEATRALGFSHTRTIVRHIWPNIMGPVMVLAASNFASAIVIEAGLSFLGVGVQPPQPSWGLMIKENYNFIITQNPMLALAPGFAIMLLVLAFNLLGNGLRDALNVRGRL